MYWGIAVVAPRACVHAGHDEHGNKSNSTDESITTQPENTFSIVGPSTFPGPVGHPDMLRLD